jgi:prepilin-type processing-associated H-X9-DG protein
MQPARSSVARAFTLVELIAVLACTVLLGAILLPALRPRNVRALRINCVNNLKQDGLAFRTWASDNNDKYPMQLAETNGGTLEQVNNGAPWKSFQVMSNELSTPLLLICPEDVRVRAKDFGSGFSNTNISYFLALDATETTPQKFLMGDRNLTNGTALQNGMLVITPSRPPGWTHTMHKGQGNILFADGSVQQHSSVSLRLMVSKSGETNHLAIP